MLHIDFIKVLEKDGKKEIQKNPIADDEDCEYKDCRRPRAYCSVKIEPDRGPGVSSQQHEDCSYRPTECVKVLVWRLTVNEVQLSLWIELYFICEDLEPKHCENVHKEKDNYRESTDLNEGAIHSLEKDLEPLPGACQLKHPNNSEAS